MTETLIFLRDDDVGPLTERLTRFIDAFASLGLPVSYQVIPKALTSECAAFLKERRASAPTMFEFGQHGFEHEMQIGGRRVFYEFGPERGYQEQRAIIEAGRAILEDQLGTDFNGDVFTPPRHRYDRNTLKALYASGFRVLSASSYLGPAHTIAYALGRGLGLTNLGRPGVSYHCRTRPDSGLFELSISIAVDNGSRTGSTVSSILDQIVAARRVTPVVGLMFHHNAYREPADQEFIAELASELVTLPGVRYGVLSEIHRLVQPTADGAK